MTGMIGVKRRIRGIPTTYRGVRMRSRLEARWAAFFDDMGWPWAYEPIDLDVYVPDFALRLEKDLLVEVKPALSLDEMRTLAPKLDASGWAGEIMIVGASIFEPEAAHPVVGLMRELDQGALLWGPARAFWCLSCGQASVLHEDATWNCRACGAGTGGGNEHVGFIEGVVDAWNAAGNRVQWRPGS